MHIFQLPLTLQYKYTHAVFVVVAELSTMTKHFSGSCSSTDKGPGPSQNRRDKKQTKTDPSDAITDPTHSINVENYMSDLNLLDKFNASTAEEKLEMSAEAGKSGLTLCHLQKSRGTPLACSLRTA
jgi:hypothetical protein